MALVAARCVAVLCFIYAVAPAMVVFTAGLHVSVLTLSRTPGFAGQEWAGDVFAFQWDSVVYALDILAWDVFFPLAALFAALTVQGPGMAAGWARTSGVDQSKGAS
jgi:hypothetical protein